MPGVTRVAILFCGQGMSTLIEYYKNGDVSSAPDNLVLIDFGGNQKYAAEASAYVVAKLKKQKDAGRTPTFDLVIISHQDGDHLSLLAELRAQMRKADVSFNCTGAFAGGTVWSETNKRKVSQFLDDKPPAFNAPYESSYDGAKKRSDLKSLVGFGSTYVRILVSGLKLSKAPQDITRNASSAVTVVENGAWAVVLPGDATYHTMAKVNAFYEAWKDAPLVPTVAGLEIPHHGSLRTAVENYTAKTPFSKLDMKIVTDFAGNMKPKHVAASAGPKNSHNHPLEEVLQVFNGNLADTPAATYVAYVFNMTKKTKVDGWKQFPTTKAIRTTVLQIEGSVKWGNIYYDLPDPTKLGQSAPTVTFEARGRIEDLIQSYGPEGRSDPWLQELMASARQAPPETILRAPAPMEGALWQG